MAASNSVDIVIIDSPLLLLIMVPMAKIGSDAIDRVNAHVKIRCGQTVSMVYRKNDNDQRHMQDAAYAPLACEAVNH
jgi:hypothetical protein